MCLRYGLISADNPQLMCCEFTDHLPVTTAAILGSRDQTRCRSDDITPVTSPAAELEGDEYIAKTTVSELVTRN